MTATSDIAKGVADLKPSLSAVVNSSVSTTTRIIWKSVRSPHAGGATELGFTPGRCFSGITPDRV